MLRSTEIFAVFLRFVLPFRFLRWSPRGSVFAHYFFACGPVVVCRSLHATQLQPRAIIFAIDVVDFMRPQSYTRDDELQGRRLLLS